MTKHFKNIFIGVLTAFIIFALTSPLSGSLLGLLIISQNVSSLVSVFVGVIGGVIIGYFFPLILKDITNTFNFLNK